MHCKTTLWPEGRQADMMLRQRYGFIGEPVETTLCKQKHCVLFPTVFRIMYFTWSLYIYIYAYSTLYLYVYIYIYMYVCMHVCMHALQLYLYMICIHVYTCTVSTYMYKCVYICIYIYVQTYLRTFTHSFVYIRLYVYMCMCIYTCMYTCIHVYMYTCIHVYTYICKYVYMYTCIYVYMYICIYVIICTFVFCIYVYYMYICICMCICICMWIPTGSRLVPDWPKALPKNAKIGARLGPDWVPTGSWLGFFKKTHISLNLSTYFWNFSTLPCTTPPSPPDPPPPTSLKPNTGNSMYMYIFKCGHMYTHTKKMPLGTCMYSCKHIYTVFSYDVQQYCLLCISIYV